MNIIVGLSQITAAVTVSQYHLNNLDTKKVKDRQYKSLKLHET